jgi:hypothetical protein
VAFGLQGDFWKGIYRDGVPPSLKVSRQAIFIVGYSDPRLYPSVLDFLGKKLPLSPC